YHLPPPPLSPLFPYTTLFRSTIAIMASPTAVPDDLVQPGHVFPLRAKAGGVLQRAGHTEAAVDLVHLASARPIGVICEIMNDDRSEEHTSELQSRGHLVCRLL